MSFSSITSNCNKETCPFQLTSSKFLQSVFFPVFNSLPYCHTKPNTYEEPSANFRSNSSVIFSDTGLDQTRHAIPPKTSSTQHPWWNHKGASLSRKAQTSPVSVFIVTTSPCRKGDIGLVATSDRWVAFLDKALFSAYTVNFPPSEDGETPDYPNFQIPLSTFLEVLQIFGSVDVAARAQKADQDPYRSNIRKRKAAARRKDRSTWNMIQSAKVPMLYTKHRASIYKVYKRLWMNISD
ncbi:hypothetical protein HDV64DRAFT_289508 [Trichoderma sp. TUCIM 5745]